VLEFLPIVPEQPTLPSWHKYSDINVQPGAVVVELHEKR